LVRARKRKTRPVTGVEATDRSRVIVARCARAAAGTELSARKTSDVSVARVASLPAERERVIGIEVVSKFE
jgi:hypothetical protein